MLERLLNLSWALRTVISRPLDPSEELLEVLACDAEPLVAQWARGLRGQSVSMEALALELERLETEDGPVAQSLALAVRDAWAEFSAVPLPRELGLHRNQLLPSA